MIRTNEGTVFEESFNDLEPSQTQGSQADTSLRVHAGAAVPGWVGGGLNHSHAVNLGEGNYAIQFFGGRADVLARARPVTEAEKEAHANAMGIEKELADLAENLDSLQNDAATGTALAVGDVAEPADSPIYRRGDFQNLGEIVPRGFLSAVSLKESYDIPEKTSGRLQLARWLTDPENPLPPRGPRQSHLAPPLRPGSRPVGRLLRCSRRNAEPSRAARLSRASLHR